RSLEALDADASFALVFIDDAAAIYLRRSGPLGALADSFAYRVVPGSVFGIKRLGASLAADSTRRAAAAAELERTIRESPFNGSAHSNLANIAMIEGRTQDAGRELLLALAADPGAIYAHERLALIALGAGRPRVALDELEREHPEKEHRAITERLKREARVLLRETEARRAELKAALAREPGRHDLADSLAAVEQRLARR